MSAWSEICFSGVEEHEKSVNGTTSLYNLEAPFIMQLSNKNKIHVCLFFFV